MTGWRTRFLASANDSAADGDAKEALRYCDLVEAETTHMGKRDRDRWRLKTDEVRARVKRTARRRK